ncbi:unnamed protein product [Orchesella dallaii]|uniref:Uncharacterized protein n=1 Tax=Orchesella dallaii TaxID=48710 RepID=A0ABP1R9B8_9HEXA
MQSCGKTQPADANRIEENYSYLFVASLLPDNISIVEIISEQKKDAYCMEWRSKIGTAAAKGFILDENGMLQKQIIVKVIDFDCENGDGFDHEPIQSQNAEGRSNNRAGEMIPDKSTHTRNSHIGSELRRTANGMIMDLPNTNAMASISLEVANPAASAVTQKNKNINETTQRLRKINSKELIKKKTVLDRKLAKMEELDEKTILQQLRNIPDKMKKIAKWVGQNIANAQRRNKLYYDKKRRQHNFKTGDFVLIKNHQLSSKIEHRAAKLLKRYIGPYELGKQEDEVNFEILTIPGKRPFCKRHVDELKPFIDDKNGVDELDEETSEEED